jgi:hypothetical protein
MAERKSVDSLLYDFASPRIRFGNAKREEGGFRRLAENLATDSSTASVSLETFDIRDAPTLSVNIVVKK